jgi:GTP-binding protein HflX
VLSETHTEDGTLLKARVHAELAAELRRFEPQVAGGPQSL